ncbi:hypothetical protein [Methylobacterium platani]|uniref:Major facilitator superfamily (MFS) profile domain-containing protein n=2 Tax=Methylobacterium platani TaxID=427683 RepID=A0A179RXA9_9HYPH|nr:hypothetical protein [Methylobacterium platani]KMO15619.1 hypothetical protein SQ03_16790 [Methylobacterium platani JCM 14648]OAS14218.1 hypothetical protein A5481_30530 [Methylobacterium platani]
MSSGTSSSATKSSFAKSSFPKSASVKSPRLRRIQWIAVGFLTAAGIINYFAGSFAPVITGYIVQGTGSSVNALLAAAAVAVLAAVAYIVLVRKPVEGGETLIPTERTA